MDVQRTLKAGARGYLLKSMPHNNCSTRSGRSTPARNAFSAEIAAGLAERLGDEALSQREVEVLQQVAVGHRNRRSARNCFIAEETVKAPHKTHHGQAGRQRSPRSRWRSPSAAASSNCRAAVNPRLA